MKDCIIKRNGTIYNIGKTVNNEWMYCKDMILKSRYRCSNYSKQLSKCRGIAKTKRCFLIGNGPSLTIADLNLLKDAKEVCFASNRIYSLYNSTDWRPDYYMCQDDRVLEQIAKDLDYAIAESKLSFFAINRYRFENRILRNPKSKFFYLMTEYLRKQTVGFSNNASNGVYEGMTVMYSMAQVAIYMGYKEIVFLGVDHNYNCKNTDKQNHFKGINDVDDSNFHPPQYDIMNEAFMKLKDYAYEHGVLVLNATRGGRLDFYNRCELDEII